MNTSDISLLENSVALEQGNNSQTIKQKLGPHYDLLAFCDFSDVSNDCENRDNLDTSIGRQLYKALSDHDAQTRVGRARQAVENSNGTCGLAWLVLAREGVNSAESAMIYSQRAVERIKQELHQSKFADYCLYNDTYTLALADAAEMAFNAGRQQDAITMLRQQLYAEIGDEFNSDCQMILREQLVNILLQTGDTKEAQTVLNEHPDNIESWHYLNALTHFSIDGDCQISRSALTCAFQTGKITAQKLRDNYSIFDHNRDQFDQMICIEKAVTAWRSNAEAMAWFKNIVKNPHSVIARESVAIAVDSKDKKRWELWDSHQTSAAYFMEHEDYKEAAKEFKAALREAERIDISYFPFFSTVTGLLALGQEVETNLEAVLKQKLENRVQQFTKNCQNNGLAALHFHSFAQIYIEMGDFVGASHCQVKALQIAEIVDGSIAVSLAELAAIKQSLAEIWYEQGQYAKALVQSQEATTKQEKYLGNKHYDLIPSLELAHDCCLKVGDPASAAALANKLRVIDPFI